MHDAGREDTDAWRHQPKHRPRTADRSWSSSSRDRVPCARMELVHIRDADG